MADMRSLPRRHRSVWLWLAVMAIIVTGLYWLFSRGPSRPAGPGMPPMVVPVRAAIVQQGRIEHVLPAIGTVTAFNTVTVRSRVDGQLEQVNFEEGQKVAAGDVLARIDPRTYQVQLSQARAQLAQGKSLLANAQQDLQRFQQLYKQASIARQQLDTQQALVQQYKAAAEAAQATVEQAQLQLDFTRITAPISGRLGLRQADVGNLISAGGTEGLVVITQTQPISVSFTLPQSQLADVLPALRDGRKLAVDVLDRDGATPLASGELTALDNQIDVATGTVRLKARFGNDDEALFPNQFVNVRVRVATIPALLVPTLAVQQGSIGAFVYLIDDDNKVHVQRVETGRSDQRHIAILSGLKAGGKVVTEGVDRLREGATVRIVSDPAPDALPSADIGIGLEGGTAAGADVPESREAATAPARSP
jgi:multidrug efflux system membrane fusion protein